MPTPRAFAQGEATLAHALTLEGLEDVIKVRICCCENEGIGWATARPIGRIPEGAIAVNHYRRYIDPVTNGVGAHSAGHKWELFRAGDIAFQLQCHHRVLLESIGVGIRPVAVDQTRGS